MAETLDKMQLEFDQALALKGMAEKELKEMGDNFEDLVKAKEGLAGEKHALELNQAMLEEKLQNRENELASKNKQLGEKDSKIFEFEKENVKLENENVELKKKLEQAFVSVSRFLTSQFFKAAVMLACNNLMRRVAYDIVQKIGEVYPFTPEQLGYMPVPEIDVEPRAIPRYIWDEKVDYLRDTNGNLMDLELAPLQVDTGLKVLYPWPREKWPKDVTKIPEEVEDFEEGEEEWEEEPLVRKNSSKRPDPRK